MTELDDQQSPLHSASDHDLVQLGLEGNEAAPGAVVESNLRLRKAIREATDAIETGSKSIDRLTRRLIRLTWGLIVLTAILAVLAIPPAVETVRHLGWFGHCDSDGR